MPQNSPSIDNDYIRRMAAEVVTRLRAFNLNPIIAEKVITADTIESINVGQTINVPAKSIVTPAAKDAARERNITIIRGTKSTHTKTVSTTTGSSISEDRSSTITDRSDRQWATAIETQLNRRGIEPTDATYFLSRQPAREIYKQIQRGFRAASIANLADVDRLADGFSPQIWVIDIERLSLIETVNLIARIEKRAAVSN